MEKAEVQTPGLTDRIDIARSLPESQNAGSRQRRNEGDDALKAGDLKAAVKAYRAATSPPRTGYPGSRSPRPRLFGGRYMIKEHDCIVLTREIPDEGLQAGDRGTVVHIHRDGVAYEVEFVTLTGQTVAVATVLSSQLRPVNRQDIAHVRELAAQSGDKLV